MSSVQLRAPFPWAGGKSRAASLVWEGLGDVANYIEPFAGSLAVLLGRPHAPRVETVNDTDGLLVNFWRAVREVPEEVARYTDSPVSELDLHARHAWLTERAEGLTEWLRGDPEHYDARIAGWWCWGLSQWIGTGWCTPAKARSRQMPTLGVTGNGVHRLTWGPRRGGFDGERISFSSAAEWMQALAARLRRVRIACGDWSRVVAPSITLAPLRSFAMGEACGVLLDPPYLQGEVEYRGGNGDVAALARAWAIENGDDPRLRIVLCGEEGEHAMPPTWRVAEWTRKGGYADAAGGTTRHRERLWFSPHCKGARQRSLLDLAAMREAP